MNVCDHTYGRVIAIGVLPLMALVLVGAAEGGAAVGTATAEPPRGVVAPLTPGTGEPAAQAEDDAEESGVLGGLLSAARQYLLVMAAAAIVFCRGRDARHLAVHRRKAAGQEGARGEVPPREGRATLA